MSVIIFLMVKLNVNHANLELIQLEEVFDFPTSVLGLKINLLFLIIIVLNQIVIYLPLPLFVMGLFSFRRTVNYFNQIAYNYILRWVVNNTYLESGYYQSNVNTVLDIGFTVCTLILI